MTADAIDLRLDDLGRRIRERTARLELALADLRGESLNLPERTCPGDHPSCPALSSKT